MFELTYVKNDLVKDISYQVNLRNYLQISNLIFGLCLYPFGCSNQIIIQQQQKNEVKVFFLENISSYLVFIIEKF